MHTIHYIAWLQACLLIAAPAIAQVARFEYEAVVTSVEVPQGHPIEGRLDVGDAVSGTLQYDLGLEDKLQDLALVGSYEALPAGVNQIRAEGGNGFVFDSSLIPRPFFVATVDNGPQFDTLLIHMSGDTTPSTLAREDTRFVEAGLLLETTDTSLFASDALPQDLSLQAFELAGLDFFGTGTTFPTFLVHATITHFQPAGATIAGDYNANGRVEQGDLDLVLLGWGKPVELASAPWLGVPPVGIIDQSELDAVLLHWGSAMASAAIIPEPVSLTLCTIAVAPYFLYRRCGGRARPGWAVLWN